MTNEKKYWRITLAIPLYIALWLAYMSPMLFYPLVYYLLRKATGIPAELLLVLAYVGLVFRLIAPPLFPADRRWELGRHSGEFCFSLLALYIGSCVAMHIPYFLAFSLSGIPRLGPRTLSWILWGALGALRFRHVPFPPEIIKMERFAKYTVHVGLIIGLCLVFWLISALLHAAHKPAASYIMSAGHPKAIESVLLALSDNAFIPSLFSCGLICVFLTWTYWIRQEVVA